MLETKYFSAEECIFCHTGMSLNLEMNTLAAFEPPDQVIASAGIPLVTYICRSYGFVACFEESLMKKILINVL